MFNRSTTRIFSTLIKGKNITGIDKKLFPQYKMIGTAAIIGSIYGTVAVNIGSTKNKLELDDADANLNNLSLESKLDIDHPLSTRKEIVVDVPVTTTDVNDFLNAPNHDWVKTSIKIYDFIYDDIKKVIDKHGFKPIEDNDIRFCVTEIIQNAYDAYAMDGLKHDEKLIIKTVVQEKNDKIFIKIKNNGPWFSELPKSEPYSISKIEYSTSKKREQGLGFLGGCGRGLRKAEKILNYYDGRLFVKNKKNGGVAIYMELPMPASAQRYIKK